MMKRHHNHILLILVLLTGAGCAGVLVPSDELSAADDASAPPRPLCCNLESASYHHLPVLNPRQVAAGYRFSLTTEPAEPRAGEKTRVSLQITGTSDAATSGLGTYPERRPHLLLVSENLEEVHHLHPEDLGEWQEAAVFEGRFTFPVTFSSGGRHWLVVEFLDRGQIVHTSMSLDVAGRSQPPTRWNLAKQRRAEGLDLTFRTITVDPEPHAGNLMNATVKIEREGKPVTDLEESAGALAHVVLVREGDAGGARHLHGGGQEHSHFTFQNVVPGYSGPKLYFNDYLGDAGRYRALVLFKREGRLHEVAFDFKTLPPPLDTP